jgi:motility quorum-sensing regulator/GCU-specific mRNA interferase toxin
MEKRSPHCALTEVKRLVRAGKVSTTYSALQGAAALGLNRDGIVDVELALTMLDFFKSMTTHGDHTIWQDVYKPNMDVGTVYLKLTVTENVLVVSFKEA